MPYLGFALSRDATPPDGRFGRSPGPPAGDAHVQDRLLAVQVRALDLIFEEQAKADDGAGSGEERDAPSGRFEADAGVSGDVHRPDATAALGRNNGEPCVTFAARRR